LRDLDLTALALLARLFRTVQLTDRGKATIDALLPVHLTNEQQLLAPLSPAQQRTLDELLRSLLDGLEPSQ
jgi:DNA-binding MarR family transcriptional regulator